MIAEIPIAAGQPTPIRRSRAPSVRVAGPLLTLLLAGAGGPASPSSAAPPVAPAHNQTCLAAHAVVPGGPTGATRAAAFVTAVDVCMGAMHNGLSAGLRDGATDADVAFAAAMIPHHEGAIDMARLILAHGDDPAMRALALGIIADQQAEVDLLRAWLARTHRAAPTTGRTDIRSTDTTAAPMAHATGPRPVSARDRVYTADQVSNTVSVIDPASDRLLGQIRLGNARPNLLSALYDGQVNVHGLAISPDGRTLAVVSTGSNAVAFIETATNRVRGTVYVGRNPHEPMFTPDGRELWVAVRGENYIAVLDPRTMKETRRIATAAGPSMIVFRPDGRVAFVNHSFTAELHVIDVASGKRLHTVPVISPFSPNLAITADGEQVWLAHKDVGKVTVVNAHSYVVEGVIETGPVTNHVTFAGPGGGTRASGASAGPYAYVTVGGENMVKVYTRDRKLIARIPVGAVPHGLWGSGDGSKVYVGLQQGDAVAVIDTRTQRQVNVLSTGQSPQALIYAVNAVAGDGSDRATLAPLTRTRDAVNVVLRPTNSAGDAAASPAATVTIRPLGPVDGIDVMARRLAPDTDYALALGGCGTRATDAESVALLATFRSDSHGSAMVEAIGPGRVDARPSTAPRCLRLAPSAEGGEPVLVAPLRNPSTHSRQN